MTDDLYLGRRATLSLAALGASAAAWGTAAPSLAASSRGNQPANPADLRVTLLGTGSPVPSTVRMGNSTLVQAAGYNLVFDGGRGLPVRLVQTGLHSGQIDGIFLTHYHSDHVNGVADAWMMGYIPALGARTGALHLYGPAGLERLAAGLRMAHADDIRMRVADKEVDPATTVLAAHESPTNDAVVFNRDGVVVRMFEVDHDEANALTPAVGYRVDYRGHSVLISGDTRPTTNVVKWGRGVDLLIHEVADFMDPSLPVIQGVYAHHTSPRQAGKIFRRTRPQMAAYSHIVAGTPPRLPEVPTAVIVERTRQTYHGPLTVGEDLMRFTISNSGIVVTRGIH